MQLVGRLSGASRIFGRLGALTSLAAPFSRILARIAALVPSGGGDDDMVGGATEGGATEDGAKDDAPTVGSAGPLYDALTQRVSLAIVAAAVPIVLFALGVMAVTADGIAGEITGFYQTAAMPGVLISFMLASFGASRHLQAQAMDALAPLSAMGEADLAALRERTLRPARNTELIGIAAGLAA